MNRVYPFFLFVLCISPFAGYTNALETQIDSLNKLAFQLRATDQIEALLHANRARERSKKINYTKGEATALNNLGLIHRYQGNYDKSSSFFLESKKLRIEMKDSIALGNILINLGMLESKRSRFNLAFKHLFEATKIFESQRDITRLAYTFENIAALYSNDGNLDEALQYYKKAEDIYIQTKDTIRLVDINYNLADFFYYSDDLTKAYSHAKKSQFYHQFTGTQKGEADILNILAAITWVQGNLEEAKAYFEKGIAIYKKNKDQSLGLVDLYTNLGILEVERGEARKAISLLNEARVLLKGKGSFWDQMYLQQNFAKAYHSLGQFDSAYYHQTQARLMQDSVYQVEKTEAIAEMQTKYETERKERELTEEKLLSQKYASQRLLLFQLLLATMAILVLLYFFFRHRQRTAVIIAEQKAKIHVQEVEELLQEQELKMVNAALEGQEVERKRVAKDLHDRLGSMLTTLKWQFDSLMESTATPVKPLEEANHLLDEAYHEVRRIAHDMNSGVLAKFGLVPALEELAQSLQKDGLLQVEIVTFGLQKRLATTLEIISYRIIQELVGNILKHAQASQITIQVSRLENHLQLAVEDNGRGFDPIKIATGMGLKNIEARLQNLQGKLDIDSGKGGGTGIFIDIPLAN